MKIKMLDDRVLIELETEPDLTKGGIYVPDVAKKKTDRGKVLAVGPGKRAPIEKMMGDKSPYRTVEDTVKALNTRIPLTVKVGDIVLFAPYFGSEVKVDGKEYLAMREEDILAIVPE